MDTTPDPTTSETVSDRFMAVIKPGRHRRADDDDRVPVEDPQYLAMMWRMIRALEARVINNPELLPQIPALTHRLAEVVNVAIAANAERYHIDPHMGPSMLECARLMGISGASASKRRERGVKIMNARIADAGATSFSEAKREKAAIAEAAEQAAVAVPEWRERRLSVVPDWRRTA